MRKIRFISFICVLALILSLCSVFSFAAAPEAGNQVYATNKQYVVALSGTKLYKATSGTDAWATIPVRTVITGTASSNAGWGYDSVRSSVSYGGNTGYVINKNVIPGQMCYRLTSSAYLVNSASPSSGYVFNGNMSTSNTLFYLLSSSDTNYYKVRAYISSGSFAGVYTGYVLKTKVVAF